MSHLILERVPRVIVPRSPARVFALSNTEVSELENMVQDMLDRDFLVDLVCLPLSQLNIILSMDWLLVNHVLINCLDKIVVFGTLVMGRDDRFKTVKHAKAFLKENAQAYMMLSSLKVEKNIVMSDVLVVSEFLEVFPEDVSSLPPKRETKFSVDLVPRT
ncbi:hypothetical protein CR513_23827, partial [Mucuna pruriens]